MDGGQQGGSRVGEGSGGEEATWQTMGFFEELITANGELLSRPRVLVVDDEHLVLAGMRRLLTRVAEVAVAESPDAALRLLQVQPIDVVLSDYNMGPSGDGLALLEEVSRRWPRVKRILHTGKPPDAATAALANGVIHEVLMKPAPLDVLQRAVASQVEGPRATDVLAESDVPR